MEKNILVLQFRMDKSLAHERSCLLSMGGFNKSELHFVNVLDGRSRLPKLDELDEYRGVILGGAGAVNISDWSKEMKEKIMFIKPLVKRVIKKDLPMLNICFGHQLLIYFLGGKIEADDKQAETGTCEIHLTKEGLKSSLLAGLPKSFWAVVGHKDSVVRLPKGAKILAYSDACRVEAYQIKKNIFGVQFHPELDKEGMEFRLELFPSYASRKKRGKILRDYRETPLAAKVLRNYKEICNSKHI
ncbi:type 1 glutamine amidotransferase [Patescibacteria group bacterium]|nr:type 1 glutamine amidotransferase [Patescibacteria group bacterium]